MGILGGMNFNTQSLCSLVVEMQYGGELQPVTVMMQLLLLFKSIQTQDLV